MRECKAGSTPIENVLQKVGIVRARYKHQSHVDKLFHKSARLASSKCDSEPSRTKPG